MPKAYHEYNDRELWMSYKKGDHKAFAFIFNSYVKELYDYGQKFTADHEVIKDCIQVLFIKIWENRKNLGETNSIKNYLLKAFRRDIIRALKQHSKWVGLQNLPFELAFDPPQEHKAVEHQALYWQADKLNQALHTLPKRQKEVIYLRFYTELSFDEIADMMDISKKSVYKLIYKSIQSLQKAISKKAILLASLLFL